MFVLLLCSICRSCSLFLFFSIFDVGVCCCCLVFECFVFGMLFGVLFVVVVLGLSSFFVFLFLAFCVWALWVCRFSLCFCSLCRVCVCCFLLCLLVVSGVCC